MKKRFSIKTACLLLVLFTLIGCNSKQDKAGTTAPATQDKAGPSAVSTQDKADASAAAARVYAQMKSGEFAAIYKDSVPGFKKSGSEAQFVTFMKQLVQKNGALKTAKEVDYKTGTDKDLGTLYLVSYSLEFEKAKQKQVLTLARSKSGKMELVAIDQDVSK